MTTRWQWVRFVVAAGCVGVFASAAAAAAESARFEERLEAARRLTWDRQTRAEGVAGLRALALEQPRAVAPRHELGRVLTWDDATRAEGIALLRELHAEQPDRSDVSESLADVLSWNTATRGEAVELLRSVTAAHPERSGPQLQLAEILSWRAETRDEAERIYRDVLAREPGSVPARIGLARLASWRGEFDTSLALYDEALALDRAASQAAVGRAEVEGWFGRPRSALETLDALDGQAASSPAARRARADAYAGLGMRERALAEYEALLGAEPSDARAQNAAQRLRDALRPALRAGTYAATESGDPRTSRLVVTALPLRYTWHAAREIELDLLAEAGRYRSDLGNTRLLSLGAAARAPLGRHVRMSALALFNDFEEADSEVTGELVARYNPTDAVELRLGAERERLLASRLSAVGETLDGVLYGPALGESVHAGVAVRFARRWDAFARFGTGTIEGANLARNDRDELVAGIGRSMRWRGAQLRLGYVLYHLAHDLDLGGFPPDELGGDGVTEQGVGGYFSPFEFTNQMLRIDASWNSGERWRFAGALAGGRQKVEDIGAPDGASQTSFEGFFLAGWRLTPRVTLEGRVERMDVAGAFDRTRAGVDVILSF